MLSWVVLGIVAGTLGMMLARPWRLPEGAYAALGAVLMLAVGGVDPGDLGPIVGETADVLLFLVGMLLLVGVVERARVFDVLGSQVADWASGSGVLLFAGISALAVVVTGLLSLDVTVILLPPVILALARQLRVDALPLLMVTVFLANIASLALPVSNLTNLLLFEDAGLTFAGFWGIMWLPNLLAAGVTVGLIWWRYRPAIHTPFSVSRNGEHPPCAGWTVFAAWLLALTLVALVATGLLGYPLWWVAVAAGTGLTLGELLRGGVSGRTILHGVSPWVLLFVIAMSIVVRGFEHAWLTGNTVPLPAEPVRALLATAGVNAVGSNVVNNVPMVLLSGAVIETAPAPLHEVLTVGTLIGANIGPALTTYGSLATILWLAGLRREGIEVATRDYLKMSLIVVPAALLAALLGATITLGILK
jgi:arsenical pump membrane protein